MEEEAWDVIKTHKNSIGALKKDGSPKAIRSGLPMWGVCGVGQCELSAATAEQAEHEQQADQRE